MDVQPRRPTAGALFGGYGLLFAGVLVLSLEVHHRPGDAEIAVIVGLVTLTAVTVWLWRRGAWRLGRSADGPPGRRSPAFGMVGGAVFLLALANQFGGPFPIALLAGALGVAAAFTALITALLFRNGPARMPTN